MSTSASPINHRNRTLAPAMVVIAAAIALTGCGGRTAEARPMVVPHGAQMADLYMNGQINDSKGYRYDIAIIPGINPTFSGAGDSYERAWGYLKRYGTDGVAHDGKKNGVGKIYTFAFRDCAEDFTIKGIGRDYSNTSNDIADLITDKPFGWYAQVAYRSTWGYLIKPTGRVVLGTIGCVGGTAIGSAVGTLEGAGRVTLAAGDVATMGTIYARHRFGIERPTVGLLSIGEEPGKGDTLRKEAYELLVNAPGIDFIGNVEGRDLMRKTADVIVTDGFTGNVALKTLEGGLKTIFNALLTAFASKPEYKEHADALLPALLPLHTEMSPDTQGGAVLLGVDGICIISHGSSGETAMVNAIKLAEEMVQTGLVAEITAAFATAP